MTEPLSGEQITVALRGLDGWQRDDNVLLREFKFGSFREAVSFIVRIAFAAEAVNHHPELWNVYSTVRVRLTTHDAGDRISQRDVDLAGEINAISWVS